MGQDRQTKIKMQDGFTSLKSILPPPSKRAVILIDPPYELKTDYLQVVDCIKDSMNRFATGTYMIWYPLLQRPQSLNMIDKLKTLKVNNWLYVSLTTQAPSADGFGMHGSGMFIINPPYTLPEILSNTMPVLVDLLGQDEAAHYSLEMNII